MPCCCGLSRIERRTTVPPAWASRICKVDNEEIVFFRFFVSYSVCFSSKCQATKLSKKPSKAPKVRPTQTKQYRSKTWHGAFEHWTIEFLCRHHWPKHSGVKQESRHHLRTLQQLQRLAYTCNIWTWYLSCLRHLHGLVVHARLHSV